MLPDARFLISVELLIPETLAPQGVQKSSLEVTPLTLDTYYTSAFFAILVKVQNRHDVYLRRPLHLLEALHYTPRYEMLVVLLLSFHSLLELHQLLKSIFRLYIPKSAKTFPKLSLYSGFFVIRRLKFCFIYA